MRISVNHHSAIHSESKDLHMQQRTVREAGFGGEERQGLQIGAMASGTRFGKRLNNKWMH